MIMKKYTNILFLFVLALGVISCGDDDPAKPVSDVDGAWTAIEYTANVRTDISGQVTSNTVIDLVGENLDYDLTFTDSDWTTSGGYVQTVEMTVDGTVVQQTSDTFSNVGGSGTFSVNGSTMTVEGSFFSFMFNGVDYSSGNGPQEANYEINSAGELVFSQEVTSQTNQGGISTTSVVNSVSKWVRK